MYLPEAVAFKFATRTLPILRTSETVYSCCAQLWLSSPVKEEMTSRLSRDQTSDGPLRDDESPAVYKMLQVVTNSMVYSGPDRTVVHKLREETTDLVLIVGTAKRLDPKSTLARGVRR